MGVINVTKKHKRMAETALSISSSKTQQNDGFWAIRSNVKRNSNLKGQEKQRKEEMLIKGSGKELRSGKMENYKSQQEVNTSLQEWVR